LDTQEACPLSSFFRTPGFSFGMGMCAVVTAYTMVCIRCRRWVPHIHPHAVRTTSPVKTHTGAGEVLWILKKPVLFPHSFVPRGFCLAWQYVVTAHTMVCIRCRRWVPDVHPHAVRRTSPVKTHKAASEVLWRRKYATTVKVEIELSQLWRQRDGYWWIQVYDLVVVAAKIGVSWKKIWRLG
jgi:hypothetical protein